MKLVSAAVIRKEMREILRDRRAILLSFLLPIFIYPVTFSFTSWLERRDTEKSEEKVATVAIRGPFALLWDAIEADPRLAVADPVLTDDPEKAVAEDHYDIWIELGDPGKPGERPEMRLLYHAPRADSRNARDRVLEVIETVRKKESTRRYRAAGGTEDLSALLAVTDVDVATEAETGGARAGALIPFLLIMTLFIGGGTLSTDLVAGEKERGTLETLYLAPIPRGQIAASKFAVVWGATSITGILNLLSMLYCYRTGLISDPATGQAGMVVSGAGVAMAFVLIPPLAAIVGGVLLGISALARSLREAQLYLAPAMLLAMIPGLLATGQHVPLTAFTAFLPIANVALAIREGLLSPIPVHLFLLVCLASFGWGALVTRWTTAVLSREDTILGFDPEPFLSRTTAGRRRATLLGMSATVLGFFYIGNLAQARSLVPGLIFSLWVLLPLLAAGTLALAWSGGSVPAILSLRRPRPEALLGGALLGAGILVPIQHALMPLQQWALPMPDAFAEDLAGSLSELSGFRALLLFAVSPGICEELVFRGAFLGLLRRVGGTRSAVLISAAFFGLIHLSVFRFLPTATIGVVLAIVVIRTRSIFPAMVLHAVYNGIAVGEADLPSWAERLLDGGVTSWVASLAALAVGAWLVRARTEDGNGE